MAARAKARAPRPLEAHQALGARPVLRHQEVFGRLEDSPAVVVELQVVGAQVQLKQPVRGAAVVFAHGAHVALEELDYRKTNLVGKPREHSIVELQSDVLAFVLSSTEGFMERALSLSVLFFVKRFFHDKLGEDLAGDAID